MRKTNIFLWLLLLPLILGSCISEDLSNCPTGRYIRFQPKNKKHNLREMENTLDLLLYGKDNKLVERFHYTKEDFRPSDGAVFLPALDEGTYTTLALFNHDPSFYNVSDDDSYDVVYSELIENELTTSQTDLFVGIKPIIFEKSEEYISTVTMELGKQTNNVNLKVVFQDYIPPTDAKLSSHISGDNGKFHYFDYTCSLGYNITYHPLNNKESASGIETNFEFKTMGLCTDSDIKLIVEEEYPLTRSSMKRSVSINLVEELKKVKDEQGEFLYDTNEKLEYNDEYDVTLTLGPNFVVLGLTIDDWAIIGGGVEV